MDAEDDDGWTALHAAIYWGNMDVAEELVMHGASVNKKTHLVRQDLHCVYRLIMALVKMSTFTDFFSVYTVLNFRDLYDDLKE